MSRSLRVDELQKAICWAREACQRPALGFVAGLRNAERKKARSNALAILRDVKSV